MKRVASRFIYDKVGRYLFISKCVEGLGCRPGDTICEHWMAQRCVLLAFFLTRQRLDETIVPSM